jgi:soluble lytic murein transglycosylase-like protein
MRWFAFFLASAAWGQTSAAIQAQLQSAERQRESVRRQVSAAVPVAGCDPLAAEEVAPIVENAAGAQKLPSKLVRAVIAQESGFKPCAESKKGAMGLMQLMPATAEQLEVTEPFDAQANIEGGTKYLRQLLERYKGDLRLALAAYNAGPAAVDAAGGVPDIAETRVYVNAILGMVGIKQIDLPSIPTPKPIGN